MPTIRIPETYRLLRETEQNEMQSRVLELEHKKTGARILLAANEDSDKVFTIGFRTPPEDSTGVAHIVEHCVLSGSRKYRTKEPFMDLYQGSLQTFMNAMTYPERTLYPVASRNEEDFANLMDVYLDAVFYPRIYEDPRIFLQEAWHYEAKEDELALSGVVYNEMRGAYSNPMTVLYQRLSEALFPDTIYAFESGGDPKHIPELSYEAFLDFHRSYYHPSNSMIFLYGDCDMEERLRYLDDAYLSHFEAAVCDSEIRLQKAFSGLARSRSDYAVAVDADPADKSFYALAYALSETPSFKELLRYRILFSALIDGSASPLREALMAADIAEDLFSLSLDYAQPAYGIGLKNARSGIGETFHRLFHESLDDILRTGPDPKTLEAALNRIDFELRECSGFPTRGLIYGLRAYGSWVFDRDVFACWAFEEPLSELRRELENSDLSRFKEALRTLFDQPFGALLELNPVPGLNETEAKELANELQKKRGAMSAGALEDIGKKAQELRAWQEEEDSPEALATIPKLNPASVSADILNFESRELRIEKVPVLCQKVHASGTTYLELAFDVSDAPLETVSELQTWASLLGELNCGEMDHRALQDELYLQTGGIRTTMQVYRRLNGSYGVYFVVSMKTLREKWENGIDLLQKILFETRYEQIRRVRELLLRTRLGMEQDIADSGNSFALRRSEAYLVAAARVEDAIAGFAYYEHLCGLLAEDDEALQARFSNFSGFSARYLQKERLTAAVSSENSETEAGLLSAFFTTLPEGEAILPVEVKPLGERNEAFIVPSKVQYVAERFLADRSGLPYNGSDLVLRNLLSLGYLHNQVRAIGGAYGVGLSIQRNGTFAAASYRDPNLRRTLSAYQRTGEYLQNADLDQDGVNKAIIGSVSAFDPPLTPRTIGSTALALKLSGDSVEKRRRLLLEALETEVETIRAYAPLFSAGFGRSGVICVVGSREAVLEARELFGSVLVVDEHGLSEFAGNS